MFLFVFVLRYCKYFSFFQFIASALIALCTAIDLPLIRNWIWHMRHIEQKPRKWMEFDWSSNYWLTRRMRLKKTFTKTNSSKTHAHRIFDWQTYKKLPRHFIASVCTAISTAIVLLCRYIQFCFLSLQYSHSQSHIKPEFYTDCSQLTRLSSSLHVHILSCLALHHMIEFVEYTYALQNTRHNQIFMKRFVPFIFFLKFAACNYGISRQFDLIRFKMLGWLYGKQRHRKNHQSNPFMNKANIT